MTAERRAEQHAPAAAWPPCLLTVYTHTHPTVSAYLSVCLSASVYVRFLHSHRIWLLESFMLSHRHCRKRGIHFLDYSTLSPHKHHKINATAFCYRKSFNCRRETARRFLFPRISLTIKGHKMSANCSRTLFSLYFVLYRTFPCFLSQL